ncbi:hypothetical protein F2P81_004008 [Scophthalmus maximus]|uniref:Uncharacterized protein n=1 Tax=Scophthalmus maximus TaxID=52904 RepID=A0A6A4TMI6_SCOMX|nr:hypothetical protein F2P81_004008 [Scophthalmus maximus]
MAAPQRTTVVEAVGIGGRRNTQPTHCAAVPPPFRIQWKSGCFYMLNSSPCFIKVCFNVSPVKTQLSRTAALKILPIYEEQAEEVFEEDGLMNEVLLLCPTAADDFEQEKRPNGHVEQTADRLKSKD